MRLKDHYALAVDGEFRNRVRAAAVQRAMAVYSDQAASAVDKSAATDILNDAGISSIDRLAFLVGADSTVLSSYTDKGAASDVSDRDIENVLAGPAWGALVGIAERRTPPVTPPTPTTTAPGEPEPATPTEQPAEFVPTPPDVIPQTPGETPGPPPRKIADNPQA